MMSLPPQQQELDDSLRKMVRQFGPNGALAILAYGYRAVEIWREEFPKDFDAMRQVAEENRKKMQAQKSKDEEGAQKRKKRSKKPSRKAE